MDSISIIILLLLFSWTDARCLPSQSSALLQLKRGFSFDLSSSNLTSWLRGSDCCSGWEGVACRDPASSGMVTALDLRGLQISGKIDPSLFNLTALVSLDLSDNFFGPAPFPPSFDRLPELTYLNLSFNIFTGQVPAGISCLTNLVSLDLSTFYYYGERFLRDPDLRELIRNLGSLRELYLDGVNISAGGIEWSKAVSGSAPRLQKLSMSDCSLSGPIGTSLSTLFSLTVLRLNQNSLNTEVPEFFGNFSSLVELSLSNCGLTGSLPDTIFGLPKLTALDVSYNRMLTGYLPEFSDDSALQSLVLEYTIFTGALPESLGNLNFLQISGCKFSGPIPQSIGSLIYTSVFEGNEGLCGWPSSKSCNGSVIATPPSDSETPPPPPPRDGKKPNIIVLAIFTGSGFGAGLGAAILVDLMLEPGRRQRSASSNPFR